MATEAGRERRSTVDVEPFADVPAVVAAVGASPATARAGSAVTQYRQLTFAIAGTDAACGVISVLGAFWLRYGLIPLRPSYAWAAVLAPAVWIPVYYAFGLYRRQQPSDWEEFRRLLAATSVAVALVGTLIFWSKAYFPRLWILVVWLVAIALELSTRAAWRAHVERRRRDGRLALRTAVVGLNDDAERLVSALCIPGTGFDPVGYVSTGGATARPAGLPVLGSLETLDAVVSDEAVDCLFVTSSAVTAEHLAIVGRVARATGTEFRMSTTLPNIVSGPVAIQHVGGSIALALPSARLSGAQYAAKRAFDIAVTSVLLVPLLPLMAVLAVLVRATSPGPALFRQVRVTRGGRPFVMLKFRSMRSGADSELEKLGLDGRVPFFKLGTDDPRITSVGRLLRKYSLDELPQLFNVLRGDMSLVGPRPLPVEQVQANAPALSARHEVPAGISGWWQIRGRSELDIDESIALDQFYIQNWSLGLDLFILTKTIGAVVSRRGAF
jgi:exopolysaccharide biosynthesis polyprenyl glycosylphosphotransferase